MTELNGPFPMETIIMSENGHETGTDETVPTTHIDAARQTFVASDGSEVPLTGKRINQFMLERLKNQGKPTIPMKEVTLLGKHRQMEANPNDPGYLARLAEWESESGINAMMYILTLGVKGAPPADFIEDQRTFFPDASDNMFKYLWVTSLVPDDDVEALAEAIISFSLPTEKGLQDAADSF